MIPLLLVDNYYSFCNPVQINPIITKLDGGEHRCTVLCSGRCIHQTFTFLLPFLTRHSHSGCHSSPDIHIPVAIIHQTFTFLLPFFTRHSHSCCHSSPDIYILVAILHQSFTFLLPFRPITFLHGQSNMGLISV